MTKLKEEKQIRGYHRIYNSKGELVKEVVDEENGQSRTLSIEYSKMMEEEL